MLTLVILTTSWGSQFDHRRSSSSLAIQQLALTTTSETENIEDLWYDVIKRKSDKVQRVNSLYRNQSDANKRAGDDFNKLIDVLANLRPSSNHSKATLRELRRAIIRNSRGGGIRGVYRNYCGPGNDGAINPLFPEIDSCCRDHDNCRDWISASTTFNGYQKTYPGLPNKLRLFSSLSCECDVNLYNCFKTTNSWLAELLLGVYSIAQSSCFAYEYKIEKCLKYDEWVQKEEWISRQFVRFLLLSLVCASPSSYFSLPSLFSSLIFFRRCVEYSVNKQIKQWQWFDLPYASISVRNYYFPALVSDGKLILSNDDRQNVSSSLTTTMWWWHREKMIGEGERERFNEQESVASTN